MSFINARQIIAAAFVAAAGIAFTVPAAQAAVAASRPAAGGAMARDLADPMRPLQDLREALDNLHLTDAEKAKIHDIVEPYRKELESWRNDNKAALEKDRADLKSARESRDRAKLQAAIQDIKTLLETAPKPKGLLEQIEAVLKPGQVEKLKADLERLRRELGERRDRAATQP